MVTSFSLLLSMGGITTDDTHVPILALSKIRNLPRCRPSRMGYECPSGKRDSVRIFGGHQFRASNSGRNISDHIAIDALWRSSHSIIRHWVFQNLALEYADRIPDSPPPRIELNHFADHPFGEMEGNAHFRDGASQTDDPTDDKSPQWGGIPLHWRYGPRDMAPKRPICLLSNDSWMNCWPCALTRMIRTTPNVPRALIAYANQLRDTDKKNPQ